MTGNPFAASGNPTMRDQVWMDNATTDPNVMTLSGTINKCIFLFALVVVFAGIGWNAIAVHPQFAYTIFAVGVIGGLTLALIASFSPKSSPVVAPIYAVCKGVLLGALSMFYETVYPGIVFNAVMVTLGVFAMMLALYKVKALRVTPAFTKGVMAATGAVMLVYLCSITMSLFGGRMPYLHDSGPLGIGISLVIVGIAALKLVIDFHVIEQGAATGQAKYMEWYGAFALTVTIIWLYLEILRLLSKLRR